MNRYEQHNSINAKDFLHSNIQMGLSLSFRIQIFTWYWYASANGICCIFYVSILFIPIIPHRTAFSQVKPINTLELFTILQEYPGNIHKEIQIKTANSDAVQIKCTHIAHDQHTTHRNQLIQCKYTIHIQVESKRVALTINKKKKKLKRRSKILPTHGDFAIHSFYIARKIYHI